MSQMLAYLKIIYSPFTEVMGVEAWGYSLELVCPRCFASRMWTHEWMRASCTKILGFVPGGKRGTLQAGGPNEQRLLYLLSMMCVSRAEGHWDKSVPKAQFMTRSKSYMPGEEAGSIWSHMNAGIWNGNLLGRQQREDF